MKNPAQSLQRLKRRGRRQTRIARAVRKWSEWGTTDPEALLWARRNADHLKNCSCFLCGHYRRTNGITIQERRSLLALRDE